jgi:hypothetical protein
MMFRQGPLWVTNGPTEIGLWTSSCFRIKGVSVPIAAISLFFKCARGTEPIDNPYGHLMN